MPEADISKLNQPQSNANHKSSLTRSVNCRTDSKITKYLLICTTWILFSIILGIPIIFLFTKAFSGGVSGYINSIFSDKDTVNSIFLTLTIAPIAVFLNTLFGLNAAWLLSRYHFPGRTLILTLIDLPFAVSPVVTGLCLVILAGKGTTLGTWFDQLGFPFLNSTPSMVLATMIVTLPIIVRELIPVLDEIGPEQELAATSLGATGMQMFLRITLPNISLGLVFGILLCNARAIGEFASVAVVSGRIGGSTETMPLRVERLFQEYKSPADFALASLLALMAFGTLIAKAFIEKRLHSRQQSFQIPKAR